MTKFLGFITKVLAIWNKSVDLAPIVEFIQSLDTDKDGKLEVSELLVKLVKFLIEKYKK